MTSKYTMTLYSLIGRGRHHDVIDAVLKLAEKTACKSFTAEILALMKDFSSRF